MGRRKNTAEAYEVLLRIARKQEEVRRREEAKRSARGLPRAPRSSAGPSPEGSSEASADRETHRGASRARTDANPLSGREDRFPIRAARSSGPGGPEESRGASRAAETRGEERAWFAGLRRRPQVSGSRGLLVRRTRPRGDLALPRAERGVDPALLRRDPGTAETTARPENRLVARARNRSAFAEVVEEVQRGPARAAGIGKRDPGRVEGAASGRDAPGSGAAGGTALDLLDEPGEPPVARSRLPGEAPAEPPDAPSGPREAPSHGGEVADVPAGTLPESDGGGDGDPRGGEQKGEPAKNGGRRKRSGSASKSGAGKSGGKSGGRRKRKASAKTETRGAPDPSVVETRPAREPAGANATAGEPPPPPEEGEPGPAPVGSGGVGGAPVGPSAEVTPSGSPASPTPEEGDGSSRDASSPREVTAPEVAGGKLFGPEEGLGDISGPEGEVPSDDLGHFDRLGTPPPRAGVGELLLTVVLSVLAAPLRLVRWLAGDTVANALGRPVEVRPATLLMGSVALVIVLASIGIYINRHSGSGAPRFEAASFAPWEATESQVPETSGTSGTSGNPDAGDDTSAPPPPGDLWASPGVPSSPGPAVRNLAGAEDSSEGQKGFWIKVRSRMRLWECEDVLEHLEKVQIYLEHELSEKDAGRSIAHKELVAYAMDDQTELYWVFVGPFRQRSEADEAKRELVELTRETLVFQNRWGTELPDYFTGAYVLADSGSISRHRWRLDGEPQKRNGNRYGL